MKTILAFLGVIFIVVMGWPIVHAFLYPDQTSEQAGVIRLETDFRFGTVVKCEPIDKTPWFTAVIKLSEREHHVSAMSDQALAVGIKVCVGDMRGTTNGRDMYVVVPGINHP